MKADTYKEPKTLMLNGAIARVYIPILTEEERNRRMERIRDAAANLLKSERSKQ